MTRLDTHIHHTLLPPSARRGDGEYPASGDHEIVRVARVHYLDKACVRRGLEHRGRIVGAQFKPGTEPGMLIIRGVVGELDAEMPATGKADHKHWLIDARELHRPHRAAVNDGLEAPGQTLHAGASARRHARCCRARSAMPLAAQRPAGLPREM